MARAKKDSQPFSIRMATPVMERLTWFCEETGQPKTLAVERAVSMYIDDYSKQQERMKKLKKEQLRVVLYIAK